MQPLGAAALPRFLARSGAGAAAGCAAVHGVGLLAAPHPGAAGTAVLAAACLPCAVHLWRQPGRAAWAAHVVLTTAMLAVHPPVVTTHHAATGLAAWTGPVAGLLAIVALLLAAVRWGAWHRSGADHEQRRAGRWVSLTAGPDTGPRATGTATGLFAVKAAHGHVPPSLLLGSRAGRALRHAGWGVGVLAFHSERLGG